MLKAITPIVPVADLSRSTRFFRDKLGFGVGFESDGYAYVYRDEIGIRLVKAAADVDTHDPRRQMACYVDVDGVDELYEELRPQLETLPEGRVRAPFDQAYGQREFHVIDEDTLLIFFGEPIRPA